jgi:DUF177 domain-containing protein
MPSDQSRSINPLRLAKAKERITGKIQLDSLARLKGLLLDNKGELNYSLGFDYDESGVCIVESTIETQLILKCQRCFKPVDIEIHKSSLLGVVRDKDEFDSLPSEYEPLELDDEIVTVEELIEDELLLSIPLSALHPEHDCSGTNKLDRVNAEAKRQPFAGLATLMKNKD